jgi:hypothetical protein
LARFRRHEEVTATIAVQRAEQSFALDHRPQAGHHRPRRFFLHQLGVVDLAIGVVENHDQVIPALVAEPLMLAAVDVEQHPGHRPPLPASSMLAPLAPSCHQARALQRFLHPGVTQLDLMLRSQLLVEVPHVQIEVGLPV